MADQKQKRVKEFIAPFRVTPGSERQHAAPGDDEPSDGRRALSPDRATDAVLASA